MSKLIDYFLQSKLAQTKLARKILDRPALRQAFKFALVGVTGTVIDWGIYIFLTRVFGIFYLLARSASFVVAATNNYTFNRIWTFRNKDRAIAAQVFKFLTVSLIGWGISIIIMYILVGQMGMFDILALAIATVIVFFWNFLINKFWTFKN